MNHYLFDTETTGFGDNAKVIQASALQVDFVDGVLTALDQRTRFYDHNVESSFGALAIHGLHLELIRTKEPIAGELFDINQTAPDMHYMIGHNISFDYEMVGSPAGVKLIDTLKICRSLWPDDEHKLGAMAIKAGTYFGSFLEAIERVKNAHDAHYDVQLNYDVLLWICETQNIKSWDDLWFKYNSSWKFPTHFSFGKHKGKRIKDAVAADRGYASWCLKNIDDDPDLLEVIRRAL